MRDWRRELRWRIAHKTVVVSALSVAREVHLATEWAAWLSFAKTPQQLNAIPVTCYMTSSYVIDFQCALNFGEALARILRTRSLSIGMWNAKAICCAIRRQPQSGLRCFISMTAGTSSALGPFGPSIRRRFGENCIRYFCLLMAL